MKTSLDAAQYKLVHGVFKLLAQAPWFDRTSLNEKECAKLVLRVYSSGVDNEDGLLAACLQEAHQRFCKQSIVASDAPK